MRASRSALSVMVVVASVAVCVNAAADQVVRAYCSEGNDLYQYLVSRHHHCVRYDNIAAMLAETKNGEVVLVLARDYPEKRTALPDGFYATVKAKGMKAFVEFPDRLAGGAAGDVTGTSKERCVVGTDFFGGELPAMSILDAGLYSYVTVPAREAYLYGAKVAGFDSAVYGLNESPHVPLLFEDGGVLICATKISDFNKSRYSPLKAWGVVLGKVLSELSLAKEGEVIQWTPVVGPTFARDQPVTAGHYRKAVNRGAEWYLKARFLIHPEWSEHWHSIGVKRASFPVGPPMDLSLPSGDGSLGVMEGHYSYINPDGSQQYRYWLRADCVAETAMTFAMASVAAEDAGKRAIAENLMKFLYETDTFKAPSSKEPGKGSYGLIGWASTHPGTYYGDDNARVLLGSILAAQLLNETRWDDPILKLILANYRTTAATGFRSSRLESRNVDAATWPRLMQRTIINPHPHFESWLWATYLWLYDKTRHQPLLDLARNGISATMARYPDQWKWTNGIQQERARMILPLAWLVRVDDTEEHRNWLDRVVTDMLTSQVACGAIREELGGRGGQYGAPKSNSHYGSTEAPVIHANGDPVADMLYTSNFALFSLNEAVHATGNPRYEDAVRKLSDFLVRVQSTSRGRADLDGCWFRAFDFEAWEFYGANADHGWGAWGTLTGWTQSFITTTLGMRLQSTCFWDLTQSSTVARNMDQIREEMLTVPEPEKRVHAAIGKPVTLTLQPSAHYPGNGAASLTDGLVGDAMHTGPEWLGFLGADLDATIDMGTVTPVESVGLQLLHSRGVGIYLPEQVDFALSDDGQTFRSVAKVTPGDEASKAEPAVLTVESGPLNDRARYIRVRARNIGTLPAGHRAEGRDAWLFVDEVLVNARSSE